jgi:hypothetical protein
MQDILIDGQIKESGQAKSGDDGEMGNAWNFKIKLPVDCSLLSYFWFLTKGTLGYRN